jgi:hypothetical protein
MNDDTHGRDVPVPALVYDIPKAVTSYRASARGAGTAEVYVRLMKRPNHLLQLFIKWLPKRQRSYLRVRASLWMRSEVLVRTFQGEGQCAVPRNEKLDRWLKSSTSEEGKPLQRTRFQAWIW